MVVYHLWEYELLLKFTKAYKIDNLKIYQTLFEIRAIHPTKIFHINNLLSLY